MGRITNIKSKPEMNDRAIQLISFDPHKKKYLVQLSSEAVAPLSASQDAHAMKRLRIDPAFVLLRKWTSVWIHSVAARQYNGTEGFVLAFDPSSGRYQVALYADGERVMSIKPSNLLAKYLSGMSAEETRCAAERMTCELVSGKANE